MKTGFNPTLITALLALSTGLAGGQEIIAQHSGYNNPLNEGWSYYSIGQGGTVGGVTNNLGYNAWFISPIGDSGYDYSLSTLTGLSWDLTITIRIVTPNVPTGRFAATLFTGSEDFELYFGSLANGDPEVQVGGGSYYSPLTLNGAGSTYNTYQLEYDASSDTASLWADGVELEGGIVGYDTTSFPPELGWEGGWQGSGSIQANWSLVSLEIIPEPSSLALLGLGGISAALILRKGKRNLL